MRRLGGKIAGYEIEPCEQATPSFYIKAKAENNVDQIPATCYCTNRNKLEYMPQFANMRSQIEMLGSLRHENIQEYRETIIDEDMIYLFVEHEERSYFSLFKDGVPEDKLAFYFRQLLSAVAYLHANGVVHRDIQPDSMFVNYADTLKLRNFFHALHVNPHTGFVPGAYGTVNYQAPELFCSNPLCDAKSDVWACGILLLGTLMWQNVFRGETEQEIADQVLNKKIVYPESCSPGLVAVLDRMLERNPGKRATAQEILDMEWVRDNSWDPPAPMLPKQLAR